MTEQKLLEEKKVDITDMELVSFVGHADSESVRNQIVHKFVKSRTMTDLLHHLLQRLDKKTNNKLI